MASASSLRCRPLVEALEDRTVPATYFIFDFTPDGGGSNFVDTFRNTKTSRGYAPNFLDFDGDRRITMTDVNTAAQRIANKTWSHFRSWHGSNIKGHYGDISSNSNWGQRWINWGRQYSGELAMVMYFGGSSSAFGRAPIASDGYNVEGSGMTYTQTIANWLVANKPSASPQDFVDAVASTAAHEFGHMLGLRHATSGPTDNLMNTNRDRNNPGSHRFLNTSVNTDNGYQQNASTELTASFRGQRTQTGSVANDEHADEFVEIERSWMSEWTRSFATAEGQISTAGYDAAVSRLGTLGSSFFTSVVDQSFAAGTPMSASERSIAANLGGEVGSYDFNGVGNPDAQGPGQELVEEPSPVPEPIEERSPAPESVETSSPVAEARHASPAPAALPIGPERVVLQRVRGRIRLRVESREGNRMQAPMGLLAGKVQAWLQDVNNDGVLDLIVRTKRNGRTLVRQFDGTTLTALG